MELLLPAHHHACVPSGANLDELVLVPVGSSSHDVDSLCGVQLGSLCKRQLVAQALEVQLEVPLAGLHARAVH
ncbi:hypothetical protein D3C72_2470380 [compost metagenome]